MAKLYCIGEALIDFIPVSAGSEQAGQAAREGWLAPMPGGATANTAVAAAKLGAATAFIGMVGDDGFGRMLFDVMGGYGVDTALMGRTAKACTTMAFVTLAPDGDREFTFARKPGADMLLSEADIPDGIFSAGDILHLGTIGLAPGGSTKAAHLKAVSDARSAGALISYDPNIRLPLWDSEEVLRETALEFLPFSDILKVSADEMPFIFGTDDERAAAEYSFGKGVSVFFVTRGRDGAAVYTPGFSASEEGLMVRAVDTTGAGDAFNGAFLSRFLGRPLEESLLPDALGDTLRFANAAGAVTVTRKGAMAGSPTPEEIEVFVSAV
ncbi:MAG: carbohydrate kinase [Clostridiales bacterium]|nr:carbohydrate kinase [Clostridiales bacterium]